MASVTPVATELFGALPTALRERLLAAFNEVVRNYQQNRWEPSELNGGKLCEAVYTIIRGHVDGKYPDNVSKPANIVDACRALEQTKNAPRSVRIQIPRMLVALYEIRNNRGVGHASGDVNPNAMDATAVLAISKWLVAELIRVFHQVTNDQAHSAVDALVERTVPIIWESSSTLRVLSTGLTMRDKMLLLLYRSVRPVEEAKLVAWVEHSNPSVFRRDVIMKAHRSRMLEYDRTRRTVEISPLGVEYVERSLPLHLDVAG